MAQVDIYTKFLCVYCARAKRLLKKKGLEFNEIDVTMDHDNFEAMVARSFGARTVPQIFIGEVHVGGSDELHALDACGELDGARISR